MLSWGSTSLPEACLSDEPKKPFKWLSEILEDPEMLEPPKSIAPKLAWKGRLTLLAAREKGGKSTLAGAAAAAVSVGAPFLGERTDAGNVLVISLEESIADFAQRLVRFGCDPTKIAVVDKSSGINLVQDIWATAEEIKPSLIIWDTLGAFAEHISGKTLDPGDGQGWTRVMMEIVEVARAYGANLLLHHSRRSDGQYRDSSAIGANVDVILEMHGEGQEPRVIKGKGRFEINEIRIKLEGDEFRLLETEKEFKERVLTFVKKNPKCSFRELRDGVSGRSEDIQKVRDTLLASGLLANVGTPTNHSYMAVKHGS